MSDPADLPRSKLDFLYRDVLGEVTSLVERLEAVSAQLGTVVQSSAGQAPADALARAAGASAAKLRVDLERSAEVACRRLELAVDEAARAARGARRDCVIWGVAYLAASLLGGAIVALLLRTP